MAQADVLRARAAAAETRDVYLPSLTVGSSIGYSYGFPVGQPTLFNAQAQSLAFSFSQPDYIRSARAALHAAVLSLQDALDQVELDTALDYLQLSSITEELAALAEEKSYAERLEEIEQDRTAAGVESQIDATRAELTAAQADVKRLDLGEQAALLRERLGNLTGLYAGSIQTEVETIPAAEPAMEGQQRRTLPSVDASYSNALSKGYVAHGDARQNYRPMVGFGVNYQRFDTNINDYNYYYKNPLQSNNFSIGVQLSIPLYDPVRSARARASAADAVHAGVEAEQVREQADEQVVQLEKSLPALRAQARVAELQAQLAGQQLSAVLVQLSHPPANGGAAPLTPVAEMQARINERARFGDAEEARFSLLKVQLSLLRATGELESWINRGAR